MLFNTVPDPANLPELPPLLRQEGERQYERIKGRISPDLLQLFEARPDFKYVLALSDFAASTIFSYPKECAALLEQGALDNPRYFADIRFRVEKELPSGLPEAQLKHRLRCFRRVQMLQIAWRDLTGRAEISEVFASLSRLADEIVLRTAALVREGLVRVHGDALNEKGQPLPLLILGMGKLGGEELNFSSDLDLVCCYPDEGETSGTRSISFRQFFSEQVRRLSNLLSDNTVDSFCYRVDLRLRPFGDAGPLASSFEALSHYYETQGRTWERYAMVKARLLGDMQRTAPWSAELYQLLQPFIYRRYLDYGAVDSLRALKHMIESQVRRRMLANNFKLGAGGIREVEFIVQVFQLVRGGRIPQLQARSLRKALAVLAEMQFLPEQICRMLDDCYVYLRRLENINQEFSDKQTQELPVSERDQARLLIALNKPGQNWDDFAYELHEVMRTVHSEFVKVFAVTAEPGYQDDSESAELWDLTLSARELAQLLELYMKNPAEAGELAAAVDNLKKLLARMPVGPVGRTTLKSLMPKVVRMAAEVEHPAAMFGKLAHLIEVIALRTPYLQMLNDNQQVLRRFMSLTEENAFACDLINSHPILLDELLMPQYFDAPPQVEEFQAQLRERMLRVDPEDLEEQMEEMRLFKKIMVFRIAFSDRSGHLPLMKVSDCLTWLAEAIVRELLTQAWINTVKRYGAPPGRSAEDPGLAVVAYGKLGGIELGYKSDLDMVFIREVNSGFTEGEHSIPCAVFYQRLVQRFLHLSVTRTSGGDLYDLDIRLRPDGDSGLLITDTEGYAAYQRSRAWTWEHQALVKARAIAGSKSVVAEFEKIREEVLRTSRDEEKLRTDVLAMREKMKKHLDRGRNRNLKLFDLKQGTGGMVDIEFIAQYLLLREAPRHEDMVLWTDNVRILDECARLKIISAEAAEDLKAAYIALRRWYHHLSLEDLPRMLPLVDMPRECVRVGEIWQQIMGISENNGTDGTAQGAPGTPGTTGTALSPKA